MDTIAFIDGQNLYHLAKSAWLADPSDRSSPCAWPSYDACLDPKDYRPTRS